MPKVKILYFVSTVILSVLLVFTVVHLLAPGGKYSEVQRSQLIRLEDRYALQFDIANHEGMDTNYTINVLVDGQPSRLAVCVRDEGAFTYTKYIDQDKLTDGVVRLMVYREGDTTPVEDITHHLK